MGWGIPTFMKQWNWSKVSSVFFMITPWKFLDWMLKNMINPRQGISHEFWAILCLFWVSTPSLSATFFVLWHLSGKIPLVNGASFGCNHVQLVTWCYLMLRKSSTTGIMGYQNPTGYKILAPQKKHKIIHSETSLQHEKKQNNKETSIKPIISSLLPSRKTHQNLSKCKIHSLPSKEKKTIQNDVWFTPSHLFLVFLFPVFFGDPFCMTKLRLWSCEHLLRYTDVVAGALRIHIPTCQREKKIPGGYSTQLNREYKKP